MVEDEMTDVINFVLILLYSVAVAGWLLLMSKWWQL
jgi:hypothetical protein